MTDVPSEPTVDQVEISCQACGSTLLLNSNLRTTVCPYCASPSVIERPPSANRPAPSFVVGFVVDHDRAAAAVGDWISSASIFARSDFKQAAPELTRGVYLPAYLYGAVADSSYQARIGENYTEIETYTTTDSKGNTVTRTRTVTKTEYRSLEGQHSTYIVDVVVTASAGVTNDALEAVEPFDLRALRRYEPSFISGWLAEDPSRSKEDCFQLSHDESVAKVGGMLNEFMPGDSHSGLTFQTNLSREVIDLVLLPVWSFALRYAEDRPPVQILVNGQTGRVGGKVPISAVKVTIAVLIGLAVVGGFAFAIASSH
jgi:DNA-directed RNA polymerase subunit RPC12/RpoP